MTPQKHVLIVEDIPGTLAGNVAELSFADITVHSVGTVREAIERLRQTPYAVVVLDWRLPIEQSSPTDDDGGLKVLQAMREHPEQNGKTPVIVVTAHRSAVDTTTLDGFSNVRGVISKLRHDHITALLEEALGVQLSM